MVSSFHSSLIQQISCGIDASDGWCDGQIHYDNAIKNLIVPVGVTELPDEFLRVWAITECVVLPGSLLSIGTEEGIGCAFANCFLPEIILPESVRVIGRNAFGHSYIRKLVVNPANKSKYNRQFKDSTIEELYLPKIGLESFKGMDIDEDYAFYRNFYTHCHCRITEY